MRKTTIRCGIHFGQTPSIEKGLGPMTETFAKYLAPIQAMNPRLTVGGGMLALIVFGEGFLAYLRPFA